MAYALDTSIGVDGVDRITFVDRFGRAFRRACAASNAFISNFHGHVGNSFLFDKIAIFAVSIPQSTGAEHKTIDIASNSPYNKTIE